MAVVITRYPRGTLGIGVAPTYSQRGTDTVLAGRYPFGAIEVLGNAPAHCLG
jgi:hypothetical protein